MFLNLHCEIYLTYCRKHGENQRKCLKLAISPLTLYQTTKNLDWSKLKAFADKKNRNCENDDFSL